MSTAGEIYVVTASGFGHLFPCIHLCNLLSSNYTTALVLPSSAVLPSHLSSIAAVIQVTAPARGNPADAQMGSELQAHLSTRPDSAAALCAIIDFQMDWTKHIFSKFNIPVVSLFTFGACAAAMEWGAWKSGAGGVNPGETHLILGLPDEMSITHHDAARRPARAAGRGPPKPGDRPPWVPLLEGSVALMFNTCDDLERPFIDYLADQTGLPAWGIGPLVHDAGIRQPTNQSDCSHNRILQWLDEKKEKSVLYIAFGSEVSPTKEEILQLAYALQETEHPFIWVVPNSIGNDQESESFNLDDLGLKFGDRGLIIRGWAPQLLILRHGSVGGFLSHCGWNSTLESILSGVPILAWPIRGDQFYNAKLIVNHLKIGYMALPSTSLEMVKHDLISGIEKLILDEAVHTRVEILCVKFNSGFPSSSKFALETFIDVVMQNQNLADNG